jgi:Protein of unknown function (DUF4232)
MLTFSRAARVPRHRGLMVRTRPAALAAAAAAAAWLLTACGSPGTGQSDPPPDASMISASAQPSGIGGPVPSSAAPSTAPSGVAGLATCRSASLSITVDDSQASGAAGSTYYPLDFTNKSGTACQLYGYPGVSFVTAGAGTGQQVGVAARRSQAFTKVTVRLAPGGTAHAWLQVTVAANYPASSCGPVTVHWLRVYPPDETAASYVGHTFNACSSASTPLLTVLPVRVGLGARGSTP